MNRRELLRRASVIVAGAALGRDVLAAPPKSVDARMLNTVRADEELSVGIDTVYLNGALCEHCSAFNVAEGWAEVFEMDESARLGYPVIKRHFGRVTYSMKALP